MAYSFVGKAILKVLCPCYYTKMGLKPGSVCSGITVKAHFVISENLAELTHLFSLSANKSVIFNLHGKQHINKNNIQLSRMRCS